jgi:hypothetical protein
MLLQNTKWASSFFGRAKDHASLFSENVKKDAYFSYFMHNVAALFSLLQKHAKRLDELHGSVRQFQGTVEAHQQAGLGIRQPHKKLTSKRILVRGSCLSIRPLPPSAPVWQTETDGS